MTTSTSIMKVNKTYNAEVVKTSFLNAWSISGVDIKIDENILFLYDEQELDAKFDLLIDGYGGSNSFIRAKIMPKNNIDGYASFAVDGTRVSQSSYINITGGKESELFFGKNMLVTVKKDVAKKYNEVSFFGNSKKESKLWEYSIENNSNNDWSVSLVERVPLSADSSIKVILSEKISKGYKLDPKTGKIEFELKLKPKDNQKISFGYDVIQPN